MWKRKFLYRLWPTAEGIGLGQIRKLLIIVWSHRRQTLFVLAFMGAASAALLLVPLWVDRLVNDILPAEDLTRIFHHLLLGLLLFLVILGAELGRDLHRSRLSNLIGAEMRERMFARIALLPVSALPEQRTGDLISRISNDVSQFGFGIRNGVLGLAPNLLTVLGLIAIMAWQSIWLLLLAALLSSPLAWISNVLLSKIRRQSRRTQERTALLNNAVDEAVRGMLEIKSGGREREMVERFDRLSRRTLAEQNRLDLLQGLNPGVVASEAYITLGILVLVSSWMVFHGHLPLDQLTLFVTSALLLFHPLKQASGALGHMSRTTALMDRFDAVLDLPRERTDDPTLPPLPRLQGDIRFEGVNFSYDRDFTLADVSFQIEAGQTVAIIGPSGSGKSTLIKLLFRFIDPDSGRVRLDGMDIGRHRIDSLRRQIALVPQEPMIFDDSLLENLRFARPDAGLEEIKRAARAAHVEEFAERLAQGYDSPLGQFGCKLSTGQRQRIAIARAFLKDPRILVLDEPTSALDRDSEGLINDALKRLWADRTVLIVAHRHSTIQNADRVLVLENGRLRTATAADLTGH